MNGFCMDAVEKLYTPVYRENTLKHLKLQNSNHSPCFVKYEERIINLLPEKDVCLGTLVRLVSKRVGVKSYEGACLFFEKRDESGKCKTSIVPIHRRFFEIEKEFVHIDGFLYATFVKENVFG